MPFDTTALGELELIDPDEQPHRLGALWEQQPHALLFLRHFG